MTRLLPRLLLLMAAISGVGAAVAQDSSPLLKLPEPAPVSSAAARVREVSPGVAAQLAAAAPKFDPALVAKPTAPGADLREIDKPRNTIVRLPNYLVQDKKAAILKVPEVEMLTPRARLDYALKKYPGLRFGSFWIFRNDGVALMMLEEDERLQRKKEFNELLTLLPTSQRKQVKPLVDQAFIRD